MELPQYVWCPLTLASLTCVLQDSRVIEEYNVDEQRLAHQKKELEGQLGDFGDIRQRATEVVSTGHYLLVRLC